ncbi:MAG: ABC transporter ATP-binding protein [Acidobacteria bacterium]|nr:MAG: ABC transporter ATP-binding protein [Acidobacteriota bacterium]
MTSIIETERLTRRYGRTEAVRELTLAVPEGSIFAFVGPNGAGKTTTIKTLMNILEPSSGRASVLGVDSRKLGPDQLRQVGYVSENQELPAWMTLAQLTAYLAPLYPTWDAAFAEQLRRQLDLPPDRKLRDFSRGMRMKAALLASLAYRPRLLVLDEPFAGLDALIRYEVITGILELSEQASWSVFISSHDIHEVERLADWVGIINEGRLHLAEPVPSLLGRFRQAEVSFPEGAALPARLPADWLNTETAGHMLRFVDAGASGTADDEARIRAALPGASNVALTPMTLEAIFVTLARRFRQPAPVGDEQ